MTLNQLTEEVSALGFEEALSSSGTLVCAANRAQRILFSECGVSDTAKLLVPPIGHVERIPRLYHCGGEREVIPLRGRAYSLEISGSGHLLINDKNGERNMDFDTPYTRICGFLDGEGELTLEGAEAYTLFNLLTFSALYSSAEADIPDGSGCRYYNLDELFADFSSAAGSVRDGRGRPIPGASVQGSVLCLPDGFDGQVIIPYYRIPEPIIADDPNAEIDTPAHLLPLLPLLTAALVWLEDSRELSDYYMELYGSLRDGLKREMALSKTAEYRIEDRWS